MHINQRGNEGPQGQLPAAGLHGEEWLTDSGPGGAKRGGTCPGLTPNSAKLALISKCTLSLLSSPPATFFSQIHPASLPWSSPPDHPFAHSQTSSSPLLAPTHTPQVSPPTSQLCPQAPFILTDSLSQHPSLRLHSLSPSTLIPCLPFPLYGDCDSTLLLTTMFWSSFGQGRGGSEADTAVLVDLPPLAQTLL